MFGNIEEIRDFSTYFFESLKEVVEQETETVSRKQAIYCTTKTIKKFSVNKEVT